jgi:ADP-ribose pyrophosphatase YjhB (NUDIX family)
MTQRPAVTVCALIAHGDKFLLVEERVQGKRVLNQPAGHLELGESLVAAVTREALEETGWEFIPEGITGVYRWTSPSENKTFVRFCFHGRPGHHDPARRLDDGIIQAVWLDRATLEQRAAELRSPLVLRCIDDYLKGTRYPLDLLVDVG